MRKILIIPIFTFFLFVLAQGAYASILVIDENGELNWNVLSYESSVALEVPKDSDIDVTKIADRKVEDGGLVSVKKDGEKITLSEVGGREFDVTNYSDNLIEIEEREDSKKLVIIVDDDKFSLDKCGIKTKTDYPIKIDPKENKIILQTQTGDKYLAVMPYDAVQGLLRTQMATNVNSDAVEIVEQEKDVSYFISGEKVINLFNIYDYKLPVSAHVSASTGEFMMINPSWLGIVNFLLV